MVPQLLPYYSIYREYGLMCYEIGNYTKAKEILTESVNILESFVKNSDDNVSTSNYCRRQAAACNILAEVDAQEEEKWT